MNGTIFPARPSDVAALTASTSRDVCEVAAGFDLDDQWEFDSARFCAAVDLVVCHRSSRRR